MFANAQEPELEKEIYQFLTTHCLHSLNVRKYRAFQSCTIENLYKKEVHISVLKYAYNTLKYQCVESRVVILMNWLLINFVCTIDSITRTIMRNAL